MVGRAQSIKLQWEKHCFHLEHVFGVLYSISMIGDVE